MKTEINGKSRVQFIVQKLMVVAAFFLIVLGPVAPKVKGEVISNAVEFLGEESLTADSELALVGVIDWANVPGVGTILSNLAGRISNISISLGGKLGPSLDFSDWKWQKKNGSSANVLWETTGFDVGKHVASWKDMNLCSIEDRNQIGYLTKVYFEKVTAQYEKSETCDFPADLVFATSSTDNKKLVVAQKHRQGKSPKTFAEHLSARGGAKWLSRFHNAVHQKYRQNFKRVDCVDNVSASMLSMMGNCEGFARHNKTSDRDDFYHLASLTLLHKGAQEFVCYREVKSSYEFVKRSGSRKASGNQKKPSFDLTRPGNTLSFINMDNHSQNVNVPFAGFSKKMVDTNYELYCFIDWSNPKSRRYAVNDEFANDYMNNHTMYNYSAKRRFIKNDKYDIALGLSIDFPSPKK